MNKLLMVILMLACVALVSSAQDCQAQTQDPNSNPCNWVKCGYGATCRNVNGRAKCECPSFCTLQYDPVCASDGRTYSNSCQLSVSNCRNKSFVTVKHRGACNQV